MLSQLHGWIRKPHTFWGWEDNVIEQVSFTDRSRTTTYKLRMGRQYEKFRSTQMDQRHTRWRWADSQVSFTNRSDTNIYMLRMGRTVWEGSGQLHRWISKDHIHTNIDREWKDQGGFTNGLKTTTYMLRMGRQSEKIRSIEWMEHIQPEDGQTMWKIKSAL
jgi:hypothetical protein